MESIELLIIGIILIFFIGLTFYLVSGFNSGAQASQAQLNVLAQQILQRITQYSAYNVSRDLGLADPNAPGYISDYAVDYLAMATTQLSAQACKVFNNNSQLAQTVGDVVYMAGYGYVLPSIMGSSLNLTAIAYALFGRGYNQYDVEVRIAPLVRLAVCPNATAGGVTFTNPSSRICSYFYSQVSSQGIYVAAKGLNSQPLGTIVYTVYYCTATSCYPPYSGEAQLQPLSGTYSYAQIQLPAYASLSQVASLNAALVIYVQKVDYPYSAAFYVFNATTASLIYGAPFPSSTSTTLYLIHDADYTYPGTNTPCDRNTSQQGRQGVGG
ncbi:MAG: hypothetical protein TU35_003825 [Thermoproteus sp. AZ2]|uniref:Uncharacterized protein n=1 Tax=Thermoproteus sp. AZ2 TaxID=1609232 RepID=A0ACC6V0W7_9CREN